VRIALEAGDSKNVEVLSASIGAQLIARGLIDGIDLHIAPVLLGGGIRLFDNPGGTLVRLDRVHDGTRTRSWMSATDRCVVPHVCAPPGRPQPRDPQLRPYPSAIVLNSSSWSTFCRVITTLIFGWLSPASARFSSARIAVAYEPGPRTWSST
jgi:hypothetical protein